MQNELSCVSKYRLRNKSIPKGCNVAFNFEVRFQRNAFMCVDVEGS